MKLIKYFTSIILIIFMNTSYAYGVSFTVGGTGVKNTAGEENPLQAAELLHGLELFEPAAHKPAAATNLEAGQGWTHDQKAATRAKRK